MKVTLFYGGGSNDYSRHDECDIEDLVNFTEIELSRVPRKGEYLDLWIGDYWIEGTVKSVYTNYCTPGNPHKKEYAWGESYSIYIDNVEVMEYYGD